MSSESKFKVGGCYIISHEGMRDVLKIVPKDMAVRCVSSNSEDLDIGYIFIPLGATLEEIMDGKVSHISHMDVLDDIARGVTFNEMNPSDIVKWRKENE